MQYYTCSILTVLGWLFWRNVYIMDNSCYIRTVQQLVFHIVSYHLFSFHKSIQDYIIHIGMEIVVVMFHHQRLQIVMDPLDDFVFFVLVVLEDSCFVSINILLFSGMWHHGMWPKFSHIFEGPFASVYPQDRGSRITWNISKFLQDYTASYPRGQYSRIFSYFFWHIPCQWNTIPTKTIILPNGWFRSSCMPQNYWFVQSLDKTYTSFVECDYLEMVVKDSCYKQAVLCVTLLL